MLSVKPGEPSQFIASERVFGFKRQEWWQEIANSLTPGEPASESFS